MKIVILVLCLAHVTESLRLRPSWDSSLETSRRRRKNGDAPEPVPEVIKIVERDVPASPYPQKVCVVVAVANHPECKLHTFSNINHLRAHFGDRLDVILMHYDEQTDGWLKELPGAPWYTKNVQKSMVKKGLKIPLMTEAFSSKEEMQQYDWIWALDEDTDILNIDLETMFKDAADTNALIVVPGELTLHYDWMGEQQIKSNPKFFKGSIAGTADMSQGCQPGDKQCNFAAADRKCKFSRVNFIEVTAPMFRPLALYSVLYNCDNCFDDKAIWGLSSMWCSFVARLQEKEEKFGCARLDQHQFVHANIKTMASVGKYDKNGHVKQEYLNYANNRKAQVKKAHPQDYHWSLEQTCVAIEGLTAENKTIIDAQEKQENDAIQANEKDKLQAMEAEAQAAVKQNELQEKEAEEKAKLQEIKAQAQAAAQGLSKAVWGEFLRTGRKSARERIHLERVRAAMPRKEADH